MKAYEIKNVILGTGISSLEEDCFYGMVNLEEVDFSNVPKDISIPARCFKNCKSLHICNIDAVDSMRFDKSSIGIESFYGCDVLAEVTAPSRLSSIGDRAFKSCGSLKVFTMPGC